MVDAAAIDGADDSVIAFSICFPQLREILLSAVLINFVKALKEFTVVFLMTAGGPPLLSGITEKYIVGATTTLSVFLYDLFLSSGDYGVSSAFSVLLALVVFTATLLYLLGRAHGEPRWKRLLMVVPLIVQLLTGGPAAIPMAILYGVVLFFPRCVSWVLLIHAALMGGLLYLKGFPAGLQPALALAAAVRLIQRGRSIGVISSRSNTKPHADLVFRPKVWSAVREFIPLMMIVAALVMTGALLWLSFSGVDAVSFDSLLPPAPGFSAYRTAVGEEHIFKYFFNSFVVALSTAVLLPLITFPAAWVIAKRGGRTGAIVLAGIQLIGAVSGMHALIPLYIIFRSLGLINTYAALVLIYLEHAFVFSLYTTSAFLRDLPASLHEAALLEGAGTFYYLRKVLLPLSRPIVFTTMIVAFLGAWNGFLPALLFIRDDWKYTIGVKIYTFVGSIASGSPRWSLFAATSVINMIFLLLLFNVLRKRGGATALSDIEE